MVPSIPLVFCVTLAIAVSGEDVTTPNLKEIFIGRCHEFQTLLHPEYFINERKNCSALWELFYEAFHGRPACGEVTGEHFRPFADAAAHPVPSGTTVYWERLYPFIYKYTDRGYRATGMDAYLPGYLGQQIVFCGSTKFPGVNYTYCPPWDSCIRHTHVSFWHAVSTRFALDTHGDVVVALNGSLQGEAAFDNNSEGCGDPSLVLLEEKARTQGLDYTCINDPPELMHMQCVSHPKATECETLRGDRSGEPRTTPHPSIAYISLGLCLIMGGFARSPYRN